MNIENVIADEPRSSYLKKVENAFKILGLILSDLKNYVRVGRSKSGISENSL